VLPEDLPSRFDDAGGLHGVRSDLFPENLSDAAAQQFSDARTHVFSARRAEQQSSTCTDDEAGSE